MAFERLLQPKQPSRSPEQLGDDLANPHLTTRQVMAMHGIKSGLQPGEYVRGVSLHYQETHFRLRDNEIALGIRKKSVAEILGSQSDSADILKES
jgi:hypothetical protein